MHQKIQFVLEILLGQAAISTVCFKINVIDNGVADKT